MDPKELTILLVDDVAKDLVWLEQSIAPLGFQVLQTDNPQDVVPRVESARPDLVILDALLPGISGFDLCKRIKTHPELAETLVVIITGVYLKDQYRRDAIQSFQADGFVTKPCRPVELQRVVLQLLAKKLGTTPLALGAKLKHPELELPDLELETSEPTWWEKLWRKVIGERDTSVESSLTESREAEEDEPKEGDETADAEETGETEDDREQESMEAGEDERKLAELLAEDPEDEEEAETTEGTIRLQPSVPPVSPAQSTAVREKEPEPTERVQEAQNVEEAQKAGLAREQAPEGRPTPRPEAIHRGVPIYGEEDFLFELRRELARCQRIGRPLTLILIRVTDLEQIVELVGSGFRRQLLWHVAEQALETLRQVDLAGHITSEELVGLIAFGSGRYGGRRIVTRVQRSIKRHPFSVGEGLPAIVPALRFGIAAFPKEGEDLDTLIAHARRDLAL